MMASWVAVILGLEIVDQERIEAGGAIPLQAREIIADRMENYSRAPSCGARHAHARGRDQSRHHELIKSAFTSLFPLACGVSNGAASATPTFPKIGSQGQI